MNSYPIDRQTMVFVNDENNELCRITGESSAEGNVSRRKAVKKLVRFVGEHSTLINLLTRTVEKLERAQELRRLGGALALSKEDWDELTILAAEGRATINLESVHVVIDKNYSIVRSDLGGYYFGSSGYGSPDNVTEDEAYAAAYADAMMTNEERKLSRF